jgi:hypothetical protein
VLGFRLCDRRALLIRRLRLTVNTIHRQAAYPWYVDRRSVEQCAIARRSSATSRVPWALPQQARRAITAMTLMRNLGVLLTRDCRLDALATDCAEDSR